MKKPVLVIMAAGMGSRYGGLKQIDPIGKHGEIIIDYSLYDAKKAGFEKLVFIINEAIYEDFKEVVGNRMEKLFEVEYVFQQVDKLPEGYEVPDGRKKPWGTGHAVLCAKDKVDAPFAVINADDFYGRQGFKLIYDYLSDIKQTGEGKSQYCMVGYILKNTLTEYGHVARGVCAAQDGKLTGIIERVRIEKLKDGAAFTEDGGKTYIPLDDNTIVSMNFWGFTSDIFNALDDRFPAFLDKVICENPTGGEFFLPNIVGEQIKAAEAEVDVLTCDAQWYGVTYREDKPRVVKAVNQMIEDGIYPEKLW